jgi:hypothetical protein
MVHAQTSLKRRRTGAGSSRLVVLLAFALASCGGTGGQPESQHRRPAVAHRAPATRATQRPLAGIPPASAVAMIPTPRAALARCRESKLLRPVCPRRVPLSVDPASYDLADGCANAAHITIASSRCTLPVWSYEVFAPLPDQTAGTQVRAWDGREWFSPSYAPMDPPSYHVHVDIQAAVGSGTPSTASPSFAKAQTARRVTDVLLNPSRSRAVSFGRVRWIGKYGELVLAPTGPNDGGEEAGHLLFYLRAGPCELRHQSSRVGVEGAPHWPRRKPRRQGPASGTGPPHVIATLKAIVRSTPRG